MAVEFDSRDTTTGPLDSTTSDPNMPPSDQGQGPTENESDKDRARNPLGYTVTEPTENEMESQNSPRGGSMIPSDPNIDEAAFESEVVKSRS